MRIAKTKEEFVSEIEAALKENGELAKKRMRIRKALMNGIIK